MSWMQYIRPVSSINWQEAQHLAGEQSDGDVVFLDVRQPEEYSKGHLPGAKLLPLGELDKRLDELQTHQVIVVY